MRTVEEFINELEDRNWDPNNEKVTKSIFSRRMVVSLIKEYSKEVIDEMVKYSDDYFEAEQFRMEGGVDDYTGGVIPNDYEIMKLKNDL